MSTRLASSFSVTTKRSAEDGGEPTNNSCQEIADSRRTLADSLVISSRTTFTGCPADTKIVVLCLNP